MVLKVSTHCYDSNVFIIYYLFFFGKYIEFHKVEKSGFFCCLGGWGLVAKLIFRVLIPASV